MNNKTIAYAIVAILAVAAVGVGIYYVYGNDNNEDYDVNLSFLVQVGDGTSVDPIWIDGGGDDAIGAFRDACNKNNVELSTSDSSWGVSINSILNYNTFSDGLFENYVFWAFYYYVDGAWKTSPVGISGIDEFAEEGSLEIEYLAFVYSGSGQPPVMEPPAGLLL